MIPPELMEIIKCFFSKEGVITFFIILAVLFFFIYAIWISLL